MQSTERNTASWQAADKAHFIHPFTDAASLHKDGVRIITSGDGVWVRDSEDNLLLDGMAGLWCVNVGYGQPELIKAAYEQMKSLAYYNAFFHTAVPSSIELAELLAEVSPPQLKRVYYANSGSEGNDTVIRLVRHYWGLMGRPLRKTLIARNFAYHGSTIGGASLSGMPWMHAQGDLPIPGIVHIEQPHYEALGSGMTREQFGLKAASWLEEKIIEVGPENVAAFIAEPVQGAGGVIVPPSTYWPEIQRICRKYDILLVSDEVICGFGRTGNWWGCQTFGFEPDLMTFAKGVTSGYVPLGGVMVSDRVADVVERGGMFNHGYTYSGHPVSCAVGVANVKMLRQERLVDYVREDAGPYLAEKLASLHDHPLIGYTDGVGLMWAIQIVRDKSTNELFEPDKQINVICREFARKNGLIIRAIVNDRMIIAPPLVVSLVEIDRIVEIVRRSFDETLVEVQLRGWI
ncbi:aspartate aminotransferase family protein [Massilia sp. CT11-137]|uniref:aspartate aminotransferase family protein n=1 Tax=Massilia sp. CT11-137 TaxID=3393901 RepID=UPI0039AF71EE